MTRNKYIKALRRKLMKKKKNTKIITRKTLRQNIVNENLPVGNFKEGHTVNIEIPWPNSNTKEYRVWKICQEILAEYNGLLTANHKELVIQRCSQQGININTANTNYSNWKRFCNASQKVSQA